MMRIPFAALLLLLCLPLLGSSVEAQTPTHKPGGFHSPDIQPNSFWDLRIPAPGLYYYHCHPHPFMQAEIEVTANARDGTVQVNIRDFDFQPKRLSVRPNETIHFVNNGPSMHTVDESVPPPSPTQAGGDSGAPFLMGTLFAWAAFVTLRRRL